MTADMVTRIRLLIGSIFSALTLGSLLAQPAKIPPNFDLPPNADALRAYYLGDIDLLRDYRPGKNAFVESPERRLGHHQAPGSRFTLVELAGAGSIRHLWTTFQPGKGNHRLNFYLNGEKEPSLSGTPEELIAKMQRDAAVPVPGFVARNYGYNLFAPVDFENGARIEMETIDPVWILFHQIDYRTEVRSAPPDQKTPAQPGPVRSEKTRVTLPPGKTRTLLSAVGPAVLRRWMIRTDGALEEHRKLDLTVRYDGRPGDAVAATVGDFFGPFRSIALDTDTQAGTRTSYLPMPFAQRVEVRLHNRTARTVTIDAEFQFEALAQWTGERGYFHALGHTSAPTVGYRQHPLLYVRGRGHWLGLSMFNTGHDHGGGDFAVIDAEGERPAFLHGINGEDYFTFAWFGQGANHPFAVAHTNVEGRIRMHYENPYPFRTSFSLYWGTYPNLVTRSVAYWYQDSPDDTTIPDAENPLNVEWDGFGPVKLALNANYETAADWWTALPPVTELDAGKTFHGELAKESFTRGWMPQLSFGPMVELTYLARQGTRIKREDELGGMGHAYLARRNVIEPVARAATIQFSHDDPVRVLINGAEVYRGGSHNGFTTVRFPVNFVAGKNEIVVQLMNRFNVNFNWAGFAWRELPAH
ncbi:DUF2961 domain-containing protein [Oleiharenicola lentus]|uniref:DUF2961 domain-containing protein n=1 Tax=Oleiharenicola lentus TaxID=2508720 RepID=UPI003F67685D